MKTAFTTGQVSKLCNVSPRTVAKWMDSGVMEGYRIPMSKDRRISRESLIRFMKTHGIPLGELESDHPGKVLLLGVDATIQASVAESGFEILSARNTFEADMYLSECRPRGIVLDLCSIGCETGAMLAPKLRRRVKSAVLVALAADPWDDFDASLFDDVFYPPVDAVLLAERIRTLTGRK